MKTSLLPVIGLLVLLHAPCAAAGKIYTWTDQSGVTHFSNLPPPAEVKEFKEMPLKDQPRRTSKPVAPPAGASSGPAATALPASPRAESDHLPLGPEGDQHRILDELRRMNPGDRDAIHRRLLKECGDAACRARVDVLMRGSAP